jgi:hypothetical protein
MRSKKEKNPVDKFSELLNDNSFHFKKGINTFFDGVAKNIESLLGPSKDGQKKSDDK